VGVLFAGIVASLTAAYYRRKLADWRARLSAYKASKETDDNTPLPRETHLLIDGEVPLEDAAEGRVPQPGPPKPDGSFDPFRGRGLWGNEHGPVTPTPADEAFDAEVGDEPLPPLPSVERPENGVKKRTKAEKCNTGKMLGGALLIIFTDLYVAIPTHIAMFAPLLIPGAEPLTPAAMKAVEVLDIAVVLPFNVFGIKMIVDSKCVSK